MLLCTFHEWIILVCPICIRTCPIPLLVFLQFMFPWQHPRKPHDNQHEVKVLGQEFQDLKGTAICKEILAVTLSGISSILWGICIIRYITSRSQYVSSKLGHFKRVLALIELYAQPTAGPSTLSLTEHLLYARKHVGSGIRGCLRQPLPLQRSCPTQNDNCLHQNFKMNLNVLNNISNFLGT